MTSEAAYFGHLVLPLTLKAYGGDVHACACSFRDSDIVPPPMTCDYGLAGRDLQEL